MGNPVNTGAQMRDDARALFGALDATGQALVDNTISKHRVRISIPAQATAGTLSSWNCDILDRQVAIQSVKILPDANLTHDGTNYKTFTLKYDDGAGGSATSIGSVDTSATDWTAHIPVSLTLTAANVVVPSGKQLRFEITKATSGVATPNMIVLIEGYIQ